MKHTPGYWIADRASNKTNPRVVTGSCKQHVWGCCVLTPHDHGGREKYMHSAEETWANVKLAAESPEMFDLLELFLKEAVDGFAPSERLIHRTGELIKRVREG